MDLILYNTLHHKKEKFVPLHDKKIGLYTCGPTVYNYAHLGNLRTFIFEDVLKRVLMYNTYQVTHVMNITDVGHLTDDEDQGEDKIELESKKEKKDAWQIAEFYTKAFKEDLAHLNIIYPDIWCKATEHIEDQIKLVQTLIDKGYTYETADGIYFDTTKVKDYGKLANLQKQNLQAGHRIDLGQKRNIHDFALWKFTKPGEKRQMEWTAFGHKGFPGWHIECSAMSSKYLGHQFDIHCGGVDHIPVHHTNEIAQSESAFGIKPWVRYWLHGEFLVLKAGEKMSKSKDNFLTLQTLIKKNFNPLAYRYFVLQTHYRKQLFFSWSAIESAQKGLNHLYELARKLKKNSDKTNNQTKIKTKFLKLINDDLNIPEALALIWTKLKKHEMNYQTLIDFDQVLGLDIEKNSNLEIPKKIKELLAKRQQARTEKKYQLSDEIREEIKKLGYLVKDTAEGQELTKIL